MVSFFVIGFGISISPLIVLLFNIFILEVSIGNSPKNK